ncbi:nuclear transport factor 2 family protein [Enterovibrio nigricans]|uniref:SnoaL-like domain-containing protein n=1 Tax=Enterovibrio nigricans DSM 22720 TaxID=1121868 RepID=A0A1T4V4T8_9GAMM|nr:nuclear transport factor 2 family protein [Enterovibrio nigricans]PKF50473.1 hypothetical protein AT251_11325 [Enterovibrio nigricans]SKA59923.1 SnoaL-like domain-containing protein [Enterovibrio nigricans DSM 22720]
MIDVNEIVATLDDYAKAYCAKDIDALMRVFHSDNAISVIGTGENELCSGIASVKKLFLRNFAEATATQFEWGWSDVIASNDHAVISQALTIHLETDDGLVLVPVRWSVVLKKTDRWVWLHRHASAAAGSQAEGRAYPTPTK